MEAGRKISRSFILGESNYELDFFFLFRLKKWEKETFEENIFFFLKTIGLEFFYVKNRFILKNKCI